MVEARPKLTGRGHAEPGLPVDPLERLGDLLLLGLHQVGHDVGDFLSRRLGIFLAVDLGHGLGLILADVHPSPRALGPDGPIRPGIDFLKRAEHARLKLGDGLAG